MKLSQAGGDNTFVAPLPPKDKKTNKVDRYVTLTFGEECNFLSVWLKSCYILQNEVKSDGQIMHKWACATIALDIFQFPL